MKLFTTANLSLALLSGASAIWIGNTVGRLDNIPTYLDGNYLKEIYFSDLKSFSKTNGGDPLNTFIFVVSTPTPRDKQKVIIDVTGLRNVMPNIALSVSGCDGNGHICYPLNIGNPRAFDKEQLKHGNIAYLEVSKFAPQGNFFFVYLQVESNPGRDNARRIRELPHVSDKSDYSQLMVHREINDTALTLNICNGC